MFKPKTKRIKKIAEIFPKVILELENILSGVSNVYIDWQNVIHSPVTPQVGQKK